LMRSTSRVSMGILQQALMLSEERSREILNQMEKMSLITEHEGLFTITHLGMNLLDASLDGNLEAIHRTLYHYSPYVNAFERTKKGAVTIDELSKELGMSRVSIDILLRLIGWSTPNLVKNLQTERYYISSNATPNEEEFRKTLYKIYKQLSAPSFFGMSRRYIEIPIIREYVCEKLAISHQTFDNIFSGIANTSSEIIELASAPRIGIEQKGKRPFYLKPGGIPYFYVHIEEPKQDD